MKKRFICKDSGSELMLYDSELDNVHILNPAAKLIYRLYEEGKNLSELEESVRDAFQVEANHDIRADIEKCINDLTKKGLLTGHDGSETI